ncbi:uncharacterized protein isoform X2 [Rhodnius prolixus]|uniref:uncharacterized protein isoform X2 n=1 Tax=Rhodnius prolixus TaxID=13249 RepID=UPI003D18CADD
MKFFILTVFVIFSGVNNDNNLQYLRNIGCEEIPPMTNLDSKRYFSGTWYGMYSQYGKPTSVCKTLKMTLKSDGTLNNEVYGYSLTKENKPKFASIHCNGSENDTKGKYTLICEKVNDNKDKKKHPVTFDGVVLVTDYDSFSIVHQCLSNGTIKLGTFLVLGRKSDDYTIQDTVKKILDPLDIKFDLFQSREKVDCKKHPDE